MEAWWVEKEGRATAIPPEWKLAYPRVKRGVRMFSLRRETIGEKSGRERSGQLAEDLGFRLRISCIIIGGSMKVFGKEIIKHLGMQRMGVAKCDLSNSLPSWNPAELSQDPRYFLKPLFFNIYIYVS